MKLRPADLLGAYALGAVDAVERARVERAVSKDPVLRDELESLLRVVDTLDELTTEHVSHPGPALWERIAAAAFGDRAW